MGNNPFFPEISERFGFGCMRLPMKDEEVDIEQVKQMTDRFLERGFNYFDTAHGYIGGKSETALREALTSRYPRERYILTDKLTASYFEKEEDIRPFFESQLRACGVDYFDFYLMHAQSARNFGKFQSCRAYETAFALKAEGKIRHVGISFHDSPEVLEQILCRYPEIELVQIQFNYFDYEDPAVQSRAVYEVCCKYGKPVVVMEPVKGGSLVRLPEEAGLILDELGGSYASYALRFAEGFEQVCMVLSGMSDMAQMEDNLNTMRPFRPLDERERDAIDRVNEALRHRRLIQCTSCRYCVDGCPMHIRIPDVFSCYNSKGLHRGWNAAFYYNEVCTAKNGKASDCIGCGQCESVCPQHLPIRELLKDVAAIFEKKD